MMVCKCFSFQLWLHLLEGAEGSQVGIYPREGDSVPAGHVPAIPMLQVITELTPTSLLKAKFSV